MLFRSIRLGCVNKAHMVKINGAVAQSHKGVFITTSYFTSGADGGRIAMLGIPPSDMSIDWTKVIFKGLFIKGIYGREMFETWYKMAALIQSGLDLSPIITHRFSIDDFQKGFDAMRSGQSGKVILSWD